MSLRTVTLRVPLAWASWLDSASVRGMLADFLQNPTPTLPRDPGPGDARISLSVPGRAVKVASGLLDESESATIRRIVAAHLGELPAYRPRALPAARTLTVQPSALTRYEPAPLALPVTARVLTMEQQRERALQAYQRRYQQLSGYSGTDWLHPNSGPGVLDAEIVGPESLSVRIGDWAMRHPILSLAAIGAVGWLAYVFLWKPAAAATATAAAATSAAAAKAAAHFVSWVPMG